MEITEEMKIPVPWGIISAKTWGNRNDKPVLMVHGVQDNADSFDTLIPLLPQRGFCYICIDLPGHGTSSHFPSGLLYNVFNYVVVLNSKVIEYLKLERVYYIGHSLGGHLGYCLAGIFPDKVIKLIIIDVAGYAVADSLFCERTSKYLGKLHDLEQKMATGEPPQYKYDEAIKRLMNGRMGVFSESGAKLLAKRNLVKVDHGFKFVMDPRLKLGVQQNLSLEQQCAYLSNIKCPVIAIHSEEFKSTHKKAYDTLHPKLFSGLENIKHISIDGNHNVHIDHPERLAPQISNFLLNDSDCNL